MAAAQAGAGEPPLYLLAAAARAAARPGGSGSLLLKLKSLPARRPSSFSPRLGTAEVKVGSNGSNLLSFFSGKVSSGAEQQRWLLQRAAKVKCQPGLWWPREPLRSRGSARRAVLG